jgi:hypothetical protein
MCGFRTKKSIGRRARVLRKAYQETHTVTAHSPLLAEKTAQKLFRYFVVVWLGIKYTIHQVTLNYKGEIQMKKYFKTFLFCLSIAILVSGCAVGNKHRYHDVIADIKFSGDIAIGVGTQDAREYIISGDKDPTFVGLSRGGYGNPFNVGTQSGQPLANDISQTISNSLSKKGFKPIIIELSHRDNDNTIIEKLILSKAPRLIFLKLNEWKSDTFTNTALLYNVDFKVMDEKGEVLAEKHLEGRDNLKGSVMNPPSHAKKAIPEALKQKIEELLNDPGVQKALE